MLINSKGAHATLIVLDQCGVSEGAGRPRERLVRHGVEMLRNSKRVAIVLGTGYLGRPALEVATEIIELSSMRRADGD